jgi:tRNA A-37 threonylcarbamoyl transferase component Bud32
MINSSSMFTLPIFNQNFNPNIYQNPQNLIEQSVNENNNSNLNKETNIIHKSKSSFYLTEKNYQFDNINRLISPTKVTSTNNSYSQSPISNNIQNKIAYINQNYQNKINYGINRYNSFQNFQSFNMANKENNNQQNNNISIINTQPSNKIINITPIYRNVRQSKIPHPQFLRKKFLSPTSVNRNIPKISTNFVNYNTHIYTNSNDSSLNNFNTSNFNTSNSNTSIINKTNNNPINNPILNNIVNINLFQIEPDKNVKLSDFIILKQIGQGGEGIIYSVKWKKNNKNYALKKCEVKSVDACHRRQEENMFIRDFIESTRCDGVLKIYANLCLKNNLGNLVLYEIMELAERDWEQELLNRKKNNLYYNEYELVNILGNLIKTFSLLQSKKITHRDVKPQNIMIINRKLKICDFGNARILKRDGIIIQRVRGSELFMSPILFKAYRARMSSVKHNTYKSDVFSLGMCIFLAAALSYAGPNLIREIYDMNAIKRVLNNFLEQRYSQNFINILLLMLQVEENKRPDFAELELLFHANFN